MTAVRQFIRRRLIPRKLLDSVALVIMILIVFQMISLGILFSRMIYEIVEQQTEKRALQAAKHVALIPELRRIVNHQNQLDTLASLANAIRLEAEATGLIITDSHALQIYNSDPRQIGRPFEIPNLNRVLRYGHPYVSKSSLQHGALISGNAPIFNDDLDIIGMVSVNYRIESVRLLTKGYLEKELFYIWVFITLGLVAAILIAQGVKRATLGLEPQEIASLFQEREAIIASIREGLVATDAQGTITLFNQTARNQFGEDLLGQSIVGKFADIDFSPVFTAGEQFLNQELPVKGVPMIFNIVPIRFEGLIQGIVMTLRPRDEVDLMARELSQVQAYSDMLRAQTHEYTNRLHAIVGMIQMDAYDDVLDFIAAETSGHRILIRQLTQSIPDPALSAFLIGKYMHALELKVDFTIDPESHMVDIPDSINRHQLVTILGNLLNNAFEAAQSCARPPLVKIFMSDYGNDLIFEIEDSGPGVAEQLKSTIFHKGVSTKSGEKRGYGLHLVKNALKVLNGGISVQHSELGGALFIIEIPKRNHAQ